MKNTKLVLKDLKKHLYFNNVHKNHTCAFKSRCYCTSSLLCFTSQQLIVFFSDSIELSQVFIESLGLAKSDQKLSPLNSAGAVVGTFTFLATTSLLNVDGLSLKSDVLGVAIPDEGLCGDDSGGSGIAQSVHDKVVVLL